jgi:hypothetical protein
MLLIISSTKILGASKNKLASVLERLADLLMSFADPDAVGLLLYGAEYTTKAKPFLHCNKYATNCFMYRGWNVLC